MNQATNKPRLAGKYNRLISIELGFNKEVFLESVNLYCTLLGLSPRPAPGENASFYSYVIGPDVQKMELRFVQIESETKENRTVLYWQIPEYNSDKVYNELIDSANCECAEPPADVKGTPTNREETVRRSVVRDPSGNLMGQLDTIGHNPFPFISRHGTAIEDKPA